MGAGVAALGAGNAHPAIGVAVVVEGPVLTVPVRVLAATCTNPLPSVTIVSPNSMSMCPKR